MEFEDFVEPEIAITAAVAAAIFSPRARQVMRKGLVYGMAGILAAGDAAASFGQSVRQGMQHAGETMEPMAQAEAHNGRPGKEGEEKGVAEKEGAISAESRRKTSAKTEGAKGKSA